MKKWKTTDNEFESLTASLKPMLSRRLSITMLLNILHWLEKQGRYATDNKKQLEKFSLSSKCMNLPWDKYSSKRLKTVGTLEEFIMLLSSRGYEPDEPTEEKTLVHEGCNGRPQIQFKNNAGRIVLITISKNLDTKALSGEKINFLLCPVYDVGVDGAPELILGINPPELERVDIKKMTKEELADYLSLNYKK